MNHFINALKKYATFSGRASRAEYWYFVLFTFLFSFGIGFVIGLLGAFIKGNLITILPLVFGLVLILPSWAVAVRRMHDSDKSGWFMLVPIYNIILMFVDGTKGDNRFGPDPKATAIKQ